MGKETKGGTVLQFGSWSKGRKILLGVLVGIALSGLMVLFGFASARAVMTSAADASNGQTASETEAPQQKAWTLSVGYAAETNAPAPILTFRADPENPMPEDGAVLTLGEAYRIGGTVYANRKLSAVTVSISCSHNTQKPYPYRKSVQLTEIGTGAYSLTDPNTDSGKSLADLVNFSELLVGVHTLKIVASCEGMKSVEVFRCKFYIVGPEWETITQENFPDSYPEALKFFGDTKRFLYRYQWVNGRYILADPDWEKEYITTMTAYPNDEPWLVHVDAVAHFEKAFDYLETSYLRVHGTNGDTGLVKASDLITEYNGCYVSRFTSSLKAISHHTFGTAVDLNASMEPNKNSMDAKMLIKEDVQNHLVFNGLEKVDGLTYYDFTYDGSYLSDPNGVPQTCVNYLLYELGFYRAGFGWAHYYKSTSDGMHFCLSEFVTYSHEDREFGLRKVYVYAEPIRWEGKLPTPPSVPILTPLPTEQPTERPSGRPHNSPPAKP